MTKEELQNEINRYAKQVVLQILRDYQDSLGLENDLRLRNLLTKDFVVLNETSSPNNDDLVHIYLDKEDLQGLDFKEMEYIIKKDILVREIFRYIITPKKEEDKSEIGISFAEDITEGLVEKYAEDFSLRHSLGKPKVKNEKAKALATKLLKGIPKEISKDALVFQYKYPFILKYYKIGTGKDLLEEYRNQNGLEGEIVPPQPEKEIIYNEEQILKRGFLESTAIIVLCLALGAFLAYILVR